MAKDKDERNRWRVKPGSRFSVGKVDPDSVAGAPGDKEQMLAGYAALWDELHDLQEKLFAEGKRSVLLVLQAMDTGGKGGTIEHVLHGIDPAGVRIAAFKAPTDEELAHDFLWRIHEQAPRTGELVVFDRSHYEDVLVVRVHEYVTEKVWRARYGQIRAFEENLVARGTTIVKVFLHISKDEQAERLQDRLDDPKKRWKFRTGDLAERALWGDYMAAFEDAIRETSTADAPWYAVPANRNWYRNWAVLRILVDTLRELDPKYPEPAEDLSGVVIE
jgi:PPK2 family polyphosphate:nucleotide phosphotransferase